VKSPHFQGLFEIGIRYEKGPQLTYEGISADSCGFSEIPEEFHDFAEREGLSRALPAASMIPRKGRQASSQLLLCRTVSWCTH